MIEWVIVDTDAQEEPQTIKRQSFYYSWDFNYCDYRDNNAKPRDPFARTKCSACKGDGEAWTHCPTCKGSGKWRAPFGLGGWTKCVACSGRGKWSSKCPACLGSGNLMKDAYKKVINGSGAEPRTIIVPNEPAPKGYSLNGSWKSDSNTLAVSSDVFTLYVANVGTTSY